MSTPIETRRSVEHVSEAEFAQKVLGSDEPVLVDFYADWCGPCQRLTPILEEIARETPNVKVVKVNVDHAHGLAIQYQISAIPYLAVFKGGQLVAEHMGLADKRYLRALLAQQFRANQPPVDLDASPPPSAARRSSLESRLQALESRL